MVNWKRPKFSDFACVLWEPFVLFTSLKEILFINTFPNFVVFVPSLVKYLKIFVLLRVLIASSLQRCILEKNRN